MFRKIRRCIEDGFNHAKFSLKSIIGFLEELNSNLRELLEIFRAIKEHQEGEK